jgi:hypothetical protein
VVGALVSKMVEKRGGGWLWSFIAIFSPYSLSSAWERLGELNGIGTFKSLLVECLLGFMLLLTSASKFWLKGMVLREVVLGWFDMLTVERLELQLLKLGMGLLIEACSMREVCSVMQSCLR